LVNFSRFCRVSKRGRFNNRAEWKVVNNDRLTICKGDDTYIKSLYDFFNMQHVIVIDTKQQEAPKCPKIKTKMVVIF